MHLPTLLVRDLQSRRRQLAGPGILSALLVLAIITAADSLAFCLVVGPDLIYTNTTATTSTILLQPLPPPPTPIALDIATAAARPSLF
jgi:hypothetical protein